MFERTPSPPEYPKLVPHPEPKELVQVIMTEALARKFELEILRDTPLQLSQPVVFQEDDLPTYMVQ
jgi:hypothetical protein